MLKAKIFPSASMTAGTTNSNSQTLKYTKTFAIQTVVSAISVTTGITVKAQASNDDTNWTDISGTTTTLTTTGNTIFNIADAGYQYVRLQFLLGASDTLTAESIITAKERDE